MLTKKILQEYIKQNPKKYELKFGDVDPETLIGVIGMTEPTEKELIQGVRPVPIWHKYTTKEIRALGGVSLAPAPLTGINETPEDIILATDDSELAKRKQSKKEMEAVAKAEAEEAKKATKEPKEAVETKSK